MKVDHIESTAIWDNESSIFMTNMHEYNTEK